jgi:hypothetical protein
MGREFGESVSLLSGDQEDSGEFSCFSSSVIVRCSRGGKVEGDARL